MTDSIKGILQKIKALEDELEQRFEEQRSKALYTIKGKKVEFETTIARTHNQLKTGLLKWLGKSQLKHIVSAPIIYSLIVPLLLFDLAISFFQCTCFRLYNIPRIRRSKYIVIDRHQLHYLNAIEKINCIYCGYANGLIAYAREIAARTEQYWCPIKHARRATNTHRRYSGFIDYADAENYHGKLEKARLTLQDEHK